MFGIMASFAVAAVLIYGALLARLMDNAFEKSGPFGDSFAPLNTLFAGLAFAALWASLRMQRQELALQREELRLTCSRRSVPVIFPKDPSHALRAERSRFRLAPSPKAFQYGG